MGALLLSVKLSGAAEGILDTSAWTTLNAGHAFTLRAPPGTVFKRQQGEDSFVSAFENPKFEIMFDYGPYSNNLADMRESQDYKVEGITIDGREGVLVTGPGRNAWGCNDLLTAAYVVVTHRSGGFTDTRLEISGCTKSPDAIATLHEIFRTIAFKKL